MAIQEEHGPVSELLTSYMRLSSAVHRHTKQVDRVLNRANHLPQDQHLGDGVVHLRLCQRAFTQKLKKWGNRATFHVRSIKSIEKSDCSLLISPIACSLNNTSSRAKVSGKNRVHTASMRNSFFDLARSARTLNSAWFKVAGYQMNQ